MGNRVLRVLHGRRLEGTLDLDLPADITRTVSQASIDKGLEWLRSKYPVDEDAAIFQRIEREEKEEEARLIRRAEKLGLYKPQSGHYQAELGEEGNIYGKSVVQEVREANEVKNKAAEELSRKEWLESEAKEAETLKKQLKTNTELQKFEEAAVVEGMFILVEHWVATFVDMKLTMLLSPAACGPRSTPSSCLDTKALFACNQQ